MEPGAVILATALLALGSIAGRKAFAPAPRLIIQPRYTVVHGVQRVNLSPHEGNALFALMFNFELSVDDLSEVLWEDPDTMPDWWGVAERVVIHKLNRKIEPFGWSVTCRVGYGWSLHRHLTAAKALE